MDSPNAQDSRLSGEAGWKQWIARGGVAQTLACALAFLAYIPTLGFQFVYDDKPQIIEIVDYDYYPWDDSKNLMKKSLDFKKKFVSLDIKFIVTNDWINVNEYLLESLYVTPGGQPTVKHPVWTQKKVINTVVTTKKIGLYKNKIFDRVFAIIKEIKPEFTERELARYHGFTRITNNSRPHDDSETTICMHYNPDFVEEKEYDSDYNCLISWETDIITKNISANKSKVKLSIITIDIERNTDILLKIIEMISNA